MSDSDASLDRYKKVVPYQSHRIGEPSTRGTQPMTMPSPTKWLKKLPMKWVAFGLLVTQTVFVLAVMREARKYKYLKTSAVVCQEALKLIMSFLLLWKEQGSISDTWFTITKEFTTKKMNNIKVAIPACLYTIQNIALHIALSNLTAPTYQVTYQLKIMTTAIISVIILKKVYSVQQWISIAVLTIGVIIINCRNTATGGADSDSLYGILVVLMACLTSGLAGVVLEYLLKNTKSSIWMRNIQLSLMGMIMALILCTNDWKYIYENGFFYGYSGTVWMAIILNSIGGLVVAMVLKHADNILKCFANTVAIVFSTLIGWLLVGDFKPTWLFFIGTTLVCISLYTYAVPDFISRFLGARKGIIVSSFGQEEYNSSSLVLDEEETTPERTRPISIVEANKNE